MGRQDPQTLRLRLNQPQSRAYRLVGPGRTVVLPWGRGVGKGWFLRNTTWLDVARYDGVERPGVPGAKGIRVVALMDHLKHFRDVHGDLIERELREEWAFLGGKIDRTTLRVNFPGGSWLQPFPASEHASKAGRGIRCDKVLVDECDDVDIDVFQSVAQPWFSEPWSLKMRLVGGTPRRGRHGLLYYLHRLGKSDAPEHESFATVHGTHADCPETVDPRTVAEARAILPAPVFRREWECDFDSAEGLVYDGFDEAFHVREPDPQAHYSAHLVGVDWGYADPGVFLLAGVVGHGADAVVHVLAEVYATGEVLSFWSEQARLIQARHPTAAWWCDPSRPDAIRTLRASAGVDARAADNALDDGVSRVADLVSIRGQEPKRWARLYVAPRCKNLLREFGEYRRRRDPRARDIYLDSIEDKNNHAMDALRYLCHNHFGRPERKRVEW